MAGEPRIGFSWSAKGWKRLIEGLIKKVTLDMVTRFFTFTEIYTRKMSPELGI